jgi:topoisomerase-4 subunit A
MVVISGASQVVVKVDQLKGATKISETVELNLADLIDVKGMKAMGNRLSVHTVQSVTLEAEHDDEADVPDPTPEAVADTEIVITPEEKKETDEAPTIEANALDEELDEPVVEEIADEPVPAEEEEEAAEPTPEPPAPKKIDFEITNPDDIDMDDKGQLGLF